MSEPQVTTLAVQQESKKGDKPSARTTNDLAAVTRQELMYARQKQRPNIDGTRPYLVHNVGAQDIPAFSPAEVTDIEADLITLEVERPTAANIGPSLVMFTKDDPIVAGEDGFMYSPFDAPLESKRNTAATPGDTYGTQEDSFLLAIDGTGFVAQSEGANGSILRPNGSPIPIDANEPEDGDLLIYDDATGTWIAVKTDRQTIVTDIQYDSTTKQLQKKTQEITVINPDTESIWTMITGGQAVEET